MFWTSISLQIQTLCSMKTDAEIHEALANLPRDLSQVYNKTLEQLQHLDISYREKIFQIVLAAKRPLTVYEMREALSVTPGDTTWDPSKLLNEVYPALATCGCLIVVDEEEYTVQTIHPSFDAFLLATKFGTNSQTADPENNLKIAEDLMSSIISTYLSYGVFGTELSIRTPALDVSSAPANIIRSMPSDTRGVREIALRLFKSRSKHSVNISASISETRQISRSLSREDFHLYRYAKMFALQYLSEYPDQPKDTLWAIHQLAKRDEVIATTPREVFTLFWLARQVDDIDWAWGHFQQKDPHRAYNPFSLSTIDTQALERSSSGTLSDWSQVIRFAIDHDDSRILYELLNHCKGHMHTTRQPENSKLIFNPPTHEPSYFDTFGFERDRSVTVDMRRYMFGPAPLLYAVEKWRSRSLRILLVSGMIDLENGQAFHAPTTLALSNKNWDSVQILITASKRYPWHKEIKDLAKAEMARNEISEELIKSVM